MGDVIQLFKGAPPTPEDKDLWEFGKERLDDALLSLEAIVEEMQQAESEGQIKALLIELKDEVGKFPDL